MGKVKSSRRASLFIDSGGWIAVNVSRDRRNKAASVFYKDDALNRYESLVTTNLVVAETHAYLLKAGGRGFALEFLSLLHSSTRVNVIFSTLEIENSASSIIRKYQDQEFSLCDAVSFAVMKELGIRDAFAFDAHFETAGFHRLP